MIDIEEVLNDLEYAYRHDMPYDVYSHMHDNICLIWDELDKLMVENKKLKKDLNAEHALVIALSYADSGLKREIESATLAADNARLRELVCVMAYCMQDGKDCDKCAVNGAKMAFALDPLFACDSLYESLCEIGVEVE